MKKEIIKLYINADAKAQLEKLSTEANMTLSAFICSQLPLSKSDVISVSGSDKPAERDRHISVYVSEEEYNKIKTNAGHDSISNYMRHTAINGTKSIKIEVSDTDITDLMERIQPAIASIANVIKALRLQNQLQDSQTNKLTELLEDINQNIITMAKRTRKDRQSICNTRLRELRKQTTFRKEIK